MASVSKGERSFDLFRKDDVEKSAGRVGLSLPAARAETVELDSPASGATDGYFPPFLHLDIGGAETVSRIHSTAPDQTSDLAGITRSFQMAGSEKRRNAPPPPRDAEYARASGEVGGTTEAFQSEPPFHRHRVFDLYVVPALLRRNPEASDTVEPGADFIVDAARDEYRDMIDPAIGIRVFR